jgi:hypothetical protein
MPFFGVARPLQLRGFHGAPCYSRCLSFGVVFVFLGLSAVKVMPTSLLKHKPAILPPCTLQMWLIWPFLLWSVLLAICYGIGYDLMNTINGPIALFNIVNYVNLETKHNIYNVQVGSHGPRRNLRQGLQHLVLPFVCHPMPTLSFTKGKVQTCQGSEAGCSMHRAFLSVLLGITLALLVANVYCIYYCEPRILLPLPTWPLSQLYVGIYIIRRSS